jgi:ribosomal protein S6
MRYRGRGRPRKTMHTDEATPELRRHFQQGTTLPPLDLLLHEGKITQQEHWAGLHLRRLHVQIYGMASPQSGHYWLMPAREAIAVSEELQRKARQEYENARSYLMQQHLWRYCISLVQADSPQLSEQVTCRAVQALSLLAELWCKRAINDKRRKGK